MRTYFALVLAAATLQSLYSTITAAPVPCDAQASQMQCGPNGCFFPSQSPAPNPQSSLDELPTSFSDFEPELAPVPENQSSACCPQPSAPQRSVLKSRSGRFPVVRGSARMVGKGAKTVGKGMKAVGKGAKAIGSVPVKMHRNSLERRARRGNTCAAARLGAASTRKAARQQSRACRRGS